MAWDEALFSAAFDATRRWLAPKEDGAVRERRVSLEPELVRLERLARLVTGLPLTLQLTDDAGGWSGDTLLLPRALDGAPTRELNEAAAVVRLAWACASRLCGFVLPRGASGPLTLVATALAVPVTKARLLDEAPTLAGLLPRLERAVREGRVVAAEASVTTWAVENLVHLALGAAPAALGGPPEAKAWALAAWELAPQPGSGSSSSVHKTGTIPVPCTLDAMPLPQRVAPAVRDTDASTVDTAATPPGAPMPRSGTAGEGVASTGGADGGSSPRATDALPARGSTDAVHHPSARSGTDAPVPLTPSTTGPDRASAPGTAGPVLALAPSTDAPVLALAPGTHAPVHLAPSAPGPRTQQPPGGRGAPSVHEPVIIAGPCTLELQGALGEALRRLPPLPVTQRRFFSRAEPRPAPVWLWGELLPASRSQPGKAPPDAQDDTAGAGPGATERQKKVSGRLERLEEPENQLAENPLVHSFEKVHTLETYKGGSKRIDGDDELAAHEKALDELDLRQVVRSHQRARSLYRADVFLDGGGLDDGPDHAPAEFRYDEWDEAKHQWLREWCRVTSKEVAIVDDADEKLRAVRAAMARTTTGLRRVFEQLEAGRAWRLRQRTGPDVDVDAVISRYGALRAGHTGEDRLYASRRRHTRDTAVLVLLDASLSTDSWVANRRVLDVEREAVVALGDALDGLFDEVAVSAFCSQTRRDCRSLTLKRFDEPWSLGARRLASLEPAGYTRIGAAIRHATSQLLECGAKKKLLLIVSDGKPSDLDRYEGRHGVADVHRAVVDAQNAGVVAHALAVDPAAHRWLPAMFGHGRASVVDRPERLVHALATVTSTALAR